MRSMDTHDTQTSGTADKPPRARVSDVVDDDAAPVASQSRQRDYLESFLAAKPAEGAAGGAGGE